MVGEISRGHVFLCEVTQGGIPHTNASNAHKHGCVSPLVVVPIGERNRVKFPSKHHGPRSPSPTWLRPRRPDGSNSDVLGRRLRGRMRHRTMSALNPTCTFQTNSEQHTLLVPVVLGQQAPIRALLRPRPVRNDDGDGAVPWKCFQLGPGQRHVAESN